MRRLFFMLVIALACAQARAADQFERYNGECWQGGQRVTTGGIQSSYFYVRSFGQNGNLCTVTVYLHGTLSLATLFQDAAGTSVLANPFSANSRGDASWYAADGRYDVQYSNGGLTSPVTVFDIKLSFSGGGGGGGGGSGNAITLQGVPISTTPPSNGQFLGFNGAVWLPTTITGFLPLTGGTLTGPLNLFGNPTGANEATTKTYVDTRLSTKADLVSGFVPTAELGAGSANSTTCLLGNQAWGPCGATFPLLATDSTIPPYSFVNHQDIGLNSIVSDSAFPIRSVQVAGGAGNQTITVTISTPLRPLIWNQGMTIQLASLPSSPTDLTSLNGVTFTISVPPVGSTPTSTFTFISTTSIGVATYTVTQGTASAWANYLQGRETVFNQLTSSTVPVSRRGLIQTARRDAWCLRSSGANDIGMDYCILRGAAQISAVNNVGTVRMTVNGAHALNATTLSVARDTGSNWSAVGGSDYLFIGSSNGDAETQMYLVVNNVTVTGGTNTSVTIQCVVCTNGAGLQTALNGGEYISTQGVPAQLGDSPGVKVLGPATFLSDINVAGNINQTGTGAFQLSGIRQAGATVTVPQGKDFSLFVGSDNVFHCQLSTLLGGGSCGGGGGGGGVSSVGLAMPSPFTVSGSPVTGAGTLTATWGSGQIPIANIGTGSGSALKFLDGTGAFNNAMVFTGSSTAFNGFTIGAVAGWSGYTALAGSVGGGSPQSLTITSASLASANAPSTYINGDLIQTDVNHNTVDAGILATNVMVAVSSFTTGHIPKATGPKTFTDGYGVQGGGGGATNLLASSTVAGVGALLCTDAAGAATTVSCSGGGGGSVNVSGTPTANQVAVWTNATTIQGLTATGSLGSPVYSVSPTLVTPTLGAATATTINKVTITQPATGSTLTIADGKTLTSSNTITLTGTDGASLNVSNAVTAASAAAGAGNVWQTNGADRSAADSAVPVTNLVTAASNFTSGNIPKAGGNNKTLTNGFGVQGNGSNLLSSSVVVGTNALLCTDAGGAATTASCSGTGSGTVSPNNTNAGAIAYYPSAAGSTTVDDNPRLVDDGTKLSYTGSGGIQTGTGGTGQWLALEGPAPSGVAFQDLMYASDATGPCPGGHGWAIKNNNSAALCLAADANTLSFTNKSFNTGAAGNVFQINGLGITQTTGNTNTLANASGVFTNGNLTSTDVNHNLVDSSIIAANVATQAASITAGNLIQSAGGKTQSDSGVIAANVVTATANFVNGHIPKASGSTKALTDGFAVQGTGATSVLGNSTISGTSVLICTDAGGNGLATTVSCPSPTASAGGSNTQLQYNNATALGGISQWTTNGTTTVTGGATGVLDLSAMAPTTGLKIPTVAGAVPTADGFIGYNSTTHAHVGGSNGNTIVFAAATTGTNTNTTCTNQVFTVISSVAAPTCTTLTSSFLPATVVYNNAANTGTTAMTLDMSASTTANAFKVPVGAGLTSGTDGAIAYDSTAKTTHIRTNGADSIAAATTATSTTVTNLLHATATAGVYTASAIVTADIPAVHTRRVCDLAVGDTSGSAITNAQLGPQKRMCFIPYAATIVEVDVAADGGTPNVIVGRNRAGTIVNFVSSALATAASGGIACSNTGGTTGLDGATTCSATLQNTGINAGDYVDLVSGTAGGTAKLMTIHVVYTVN